MILLPWGVNGSWWRTVHAPAFWGAYYAALGVLLLAGIVAAAVGDPGPLAVGCWLVLGAVLGGACMHRWFSRQRSVSSSTR